MAAKWMEQADGEEHTAVRGADYQAKTEHFVGTLARRSASKGMPVKIYVDGDVVTFAFEPRTPAPAPEETATE